MTERTELDVASSNIPTGFDKPVETAKDCVRGAKAENTNRAYATDWREFTSWCWRQGFEPLPSNPQIVSLYLSALASGTAGRRAMRVASIERRLSGLAWGFTQRGCVIDRANPHVAEVLAGVRGKHAHSPLTKDAVLSDDLLAMLGTLEHDLRGLRDRAILLVGFAGALRRSEIVGLDCVLSDTEDGTGWVEIEKKGAFVRVRGKTGWREIEIGRGSKTTTSTCPVLALERWLEYSRIVHGPVFRGISRNGKKVLAERLTDKHVARLVQKTAIAAGLRTDLSEHERRLKFGGHSLRAGLVTATEIDEWHVQK